MNKKIKLVFLDIDGVLNSENWYKIRGTHLDQFDPVLIENLNKIIQATSANIVVSSSWRILHSFENLRFQLQNAGVRADIIGVTDVLRCDGFFIPRGCEIKKYLQDEHNYPIMEWDLNDQKTNLKSYVILDDDSDMLYEQRNNFVHITYKTGLTIKDVDKAIKILNKED